MKYLKNQITHYLIYDILVSTAMYLMQYTMYSIIKFNFFVILQFFIQQILILYVSNFTNISDSELQYMITYIQAFAVILAMLIMEKLL